MMALGVSRPTPAWIALGAAAILSIAFPAVRAAEPGSLSDSQLREKARRIQALVETKTLQAHGMVAMFVRATDFALPTAADYATMAPHRHMRGKKEADLGLPPMHVWRAWENTTSNTGFYLAALAFQFRATGDPEALQRARRTFGAVKYIYDLGATDERGFICKPYGGDYNRQSSSDQIQCLLMGLEAYRHIASAADRAVLDEMFRTIADLQIKHHYYPKHGYFGTPTTREHIEDNKRKWSIAAIFVPLLHRAWVATGDAKYLQEIDGWYARCDVNRIIPVPAGTVRGSPAARMLYLPGLMMELDPRQHRLWRGLMLERFRVMRTGVLPDGTMYSGWTHDYVTGETKPTSPGFGGGPTRTGRSSIFAWGCVTAQQWFPDEQMAATARKILEGLDLNTFRFILPATPGDTLPADWKTEGELLDHDSLVGWLLAYWEGVWRGFW